MIISILKIFPIVLIILFSEINAQNNLYINSYIEFTGIDDQNGNTNSIILLHGGVSYRTQNYFLSLDLPLIFSHENSTSNSNIINNSGGGMHSMNGSNTGTAASLQKIGLGDMVVNGNYTIFPETEYVPSIFIGGYLKIPTSVNIENYSSGKLDYRGSIGLKKIINNILLYAEVGYMVLGKSENQTINGLMTLNTGIGYTFNGGNHSIFLAYNSFADLLPDNFTSNQIGIGYGFRLSKKLTITSILSTKPGSDFGNYNISGGINLRI